MSISNSEPRTTDAPAKEHSTALRAGSIGVLGILFFVLSAQAPLTGIVGASPLAAALARDHPYDFRRRAPNSNGAITPELERDTRRFVQNYWLVWRTTTLRKYLEARLQERGA